jgi:hypothetical protein
MNSNSWADGLLLSAGISQATIDQFVTALQNATIVTTADGVQTPTRVAFGYSNGNTILSYF